MQSSRLFFIIGALWLIFAIGLAATQLLGPASVNVEWSTATELNTAGFNLYRSTDRQGDFQQVNAAMIPSGGSATSGSSYSYSDRDVDAGQTYYYLLEEVELSGTTRRYNEDMFTYTVPRLTPTAAIITAVSTLIGLALFIAGVRERKRSLNGDIK